MASAGFDNHGKGGAYFHASVEEFLSLSDESIFGQLAEAHKFDLDQASKFAWQSQIAVLKKALDSNVGCHYIYFEFPVPRMGKRVDVVLLSGAAVLALEFKNGATAYHAVDQRQAHDYALDLKNFHLGSHEAKVIPLLVATQAPDGVGFRSLVFADDGVAAPIGCNSQELADAIAQVGMLGHEEKIDPYLWSASGYKPTPTIVEAARVLYAGHNVASIARSDAGAKNLARTSRAIDAVITNAKDERFKAICFVTGVPGAGKTLVGLNAATRHAQAGGAVDAVFLSGNGPLVAVLREALARDQHKNSGAVKSEAQRSASKFIQNVHHFRDEALNSSQAPPDKVVVFDEAQRAWDKHQTSKFMREKRGRLSFEQSEPEFLLSVMDRHHDWCVVVCLVGGGQEINTGEAGLIEWFRALRSTCPEWRVFVSQEVNAEELSSEMSKLDRPTLRIFEDADLHLGVSMRSFRAERMSEFVDAVLDQRVTEACALAAELREKYPLRVTRDLFAAKQWLKLKARGNERTGLLASSDGLRLRPHGIFVKQEIKPENWFLNNPEDVRSSNHLEEVAIEYDVQGLELDWTCLCWDADLRRKDADWDFYKFRGTKWNRVRQSTQQRYKLNAYRVLLTRARQGLVVFVPSGAVDDGTCPASFYDATFQHLMACGFEPI